MVDSMQDNHKLQETCEKQSKSAKKKLFRGLVACVLAFVLLIGCSFAYFTDYATTNATGTAGTVAVSLDSGINLLDAEGRDILNPGDQRDAGFTVTNEGNKSIDVRTTIVLEMPVEGSAFDESSLTTQCVYDLYLREDVEYVDGRGYLPKAGAQPLQTKSLRRVNEMCNTLVYSLPEYTLNGNSDKYNEVETVDGVDMFEYEHDIVLIMDAQASNTYQNMTVYLAVFVEAKQHENTEAGWELVAKDTHFSPFGAEFEIVVGEDILTQNDYTPEPPKTYLEATITLNGTPLSNTDFKLIDPIMGEPAYSVQTDENGYFKIEVSPDFEVEGLFLRLTSDTSKRLHVDINRGKLNTANWDIIQ